MTQRLNRSIFCSLRVGSVAAITTAALAAGCAHGHPRRSSGSPSTPRVGPSVTQGLAPPTLPAGVLASIAVHTGDAPTAAAPGFGSMWLAVHRGANVYRINPSNNKIIASIEVDDPACCVPVVAGGRVWAGVHAIDPTTNRVVATIPEPGPATVLLAVDNIPWAAGSPYGLQRINPRTGAIMQTFHVNANLRHVSNPDIEAAYGDGALWVIVVADSDQTFGGAVVELDAHTGHIRHAYKVPDPGGYADIQFLDHAIWLKGDDDGRLVKLDDRTGRSTVYYLPDFAPFDGSYPHTIAIGLGDLWVRMNSGLVVRFDPKKATVTGQYPADASAGGGFPSIGFHSLWLPNFDTDTFWRVRVP